MTVRDVSPADLPPLRDLAERAFRSAFAAQNDPADLDAYVRDAFDPARLGGEVADPATQYMVAESDGTLVGYATLRDSEVEDCVTGPRPLEIQRIYAAPEAIGQGVGTALMRACLDRARRQGFETVWLGVWEENARAIAFYERWGFRVVGSHVFRLGSDDQTDLILERPVGSAA